jgi:hypothetical protein
VCSRELLQQSCNRARSCNRAIGPSIGPLLQNSARTQHASESGVGSVEAGGYAVLAGGLVSSIASWRFSSLYESGVGMRRGWRVCGLSWRFS